MWSDSLRDAQEGNDPPGVAPSLVAADGSALQGAPAEHKADRASFSAFCAPGPPALSCDFSPLLFFVDHLPSYSFIFFSFD